MSSEAEPLASATIETLNKIDAECRLFASPQARRALAMLAAELEGGDRLKLITRLRKDFSAEQAGQLMALALARISAAPKFADSQRLYFDQEATEQATSEAIAIDRAERVARLATAGLWLDLGCGIGGDLLALAAKNPTIGYENDPRRAAFARLNLAQRQLPCDVRTEDWLRALQKSALPEASAAFVDPVRRIGRKRLVGLEEMLPPFSAFESILERLSLLVIKASPAIPAAPQRAGLEFISHAGSCKEAVLWFGARPGERWARMVDGPEGPIEIAGDPNDWPERIALSELEYIYDPNPAAIRARALGPLSRELRGGVLSPSLAYLGSRTLAASPWLRAYKILDSFPYHPKRLRDALNGLGVAQVEIKKRGINLDPIELRRNLKLARRGEACTVIIAGLDDGPRAFLTRPLIRGSLADEDLDTDESES